MKLETIPREKQAFLLQVLIQSFLYVFKKALNNNSKKLVTGPLRQPKKKSIALYGMTMQALNCALYLIETSNTICTSSSFGPFGRDRLNNLISHIPVRHRICKILAVNTRVPRDHSVGTAFSLNEQGQLLSKEEGIG